MTGKVVHVRGSLPYEVYIGRPMPHYGLNGSKYANPFTVKRWGLKEALRLYEKRIRSDEVLMNQVHRLRGATLACWCAPKDRALTVEDETVCHGQILLRLAGVAS